MVPVTARSANQAPIIKGGKIGAAAMVCLVHGKRLYTLPVAFVEEREPGQSGSANDLNTIANHILNEHVIVS